MTRQTERTKAAITKAFPDLVFSRQYEDIRISDIADAANVGRSTIYKHYKDKDAVLVASMEWVLYGLSSCAIEQESVNTAIDVLEHIWSRRDKARKLLFGSTGRKLEAALSAMLEERLNTVDASACLTVPHIFVANQIAASMFSVLRTWLKAEASASPEQLAQYLRRNATASYRAALDR